MKIYVANKVGDDFLYWKSEKIIIEAPTGTGKTFFIVKKLLPMYRRRKLKLLILCNRRLLRLQYWYQILQEYQDYFELEETVEVKTYQEVAISIMNGMSANAIFRDYAGICLDEVHYFFSNSDFNGFRTYPLLQAIIGACLKKNMVFMSATIECILPWIKKIFAAYQLQISFEELNSSYPSTAFEFKEYRLDASENYQHIKCVAVADIETLCEKFGHAEGKSIIFIDDKSKADEIVELLQSRGGLASKDIAKINADNLENVENDSVITSLALANRLDKKILITTAVLDNGVSIHDSEVENAAIITESEVSFLQMLGRIRNESVDELRLFFLIRPALFFAYRELGLKKVLDITKVTSRNELYRRRFDIFCNVWDGSDTGEIYKKFYSFIV